MRNVDCLAGLSCRSYPNPIAPTVSALNFVDYHACVGCTACIVRAGRFSEVIRSNNQLHRDCHSSVLRYEAPMSEAKPKRRVWQIHLSTTVLFIAVGGLMLMLDSIEFTEGTY